MRAQSKNLAFLFTKNSSFAKVEGEASERFALKYRSALIPEVFSTRQRAPRRCPKKSARVECVGDCGSRNATRGGLLPYRSERQIVVVGRFWKKAATSLRGTFH